MGGTGSVICFWCKVDLVKGQCPKCFELCCSMCGWPESRHVGEKFGHPFKNRKRRRKQE